MRELGVVVGVSPILHSSKGVFPSRINTVNTPQVREDSQEDSEIINQLNDDVWSGYLSF